MRLCVCALKGTRVHTFLIRYKKICNSCGLTFNLIETISSLGMQSGLQNRKPAQHTPYCVFDAIVAKR